MYIHNYISYNYLPTYLPTYQPTNTSQQSNCRSSESFPPSVPCASTKTLMRPSKNRA